MALLTAVTETGAVRGVKGANPAISVFRAIPFAAPPVGNRRFMPPEPAAPWAGERLCDHFAPACIQQLGSFGLYQKEFYPGEKRISEDCLYLNVWTPAASPEERLPVMFWIHGGGFGAGYSYEMEFDGEALGKQGVILVTVAYRCGALGFFAHPELSRRSATGCSGNLGIQDQFLALRWVRQNIAAFGGDPENITVFGQSAGGASVQAFLASPLVQGQFRRAIIQSAGAVNDRGRNRTLAELEQQGVLALEMLGWSVDELFTRDAAEVNTKLTEACTQVTGNRMSLGPVTDGYVLPDTPERAIARGDYLQGVSLMHGTVGGDGDLFAPGVQDGAASRIQAALPPVAFARVQEHAGRDPIYTYFFDRNLPGDDNGPFHSSELWYVFGTLNRCWRPFTGYDYDLSNAMIRYWAAFARTGDPNTEGLPAWPKNLASAPLSMVFSDDGFGARETICSEEARAALAKMVVSAQAGL